MQTASQIMAAKRQAKQNALIAKEAKRQIAPRPQDRNVLSKISVQQQQNRASLRRGTPAPEEHYLNHAIALHFALQDLVYTDDPAVILCRLTHLITAAKAVAALYADRELAIAARAAEAAHKRFQAEHKELSPNQKRALLRPLAELIDRDYAYGHILPEATADRIAGYVTAVRVMLQLKALYLKPKWQHAALLETIQGRSINDTAKHFRVKVPEARAAVLACAWHLWNIADSVENIGHPPCGIPELRQEKWQPYADEQHLHDIVRHMRDNCLIPFEDATGILLLDYNAFRKDIVEIEKRPHS